MVPRLLIAEWLWSDGCGYKYSVVIKIAPRMCKGNEKFIALGIKKWSRQFEITCSIFFVFRENKIYQNYSLTTRRVTTCSSIII